MPGGREAPSQRSYLPAPAWLSGADSLPDGASSWLNTRLLRWLLHKSAPRKLLRGRGRAWEALCARDTPWAEPIGQDWHSSLQN